MGFNLICAVISMSTGSHHAQDKTPAPVAGALWGFTGQLLPAWLADNSKPSGFLVLAFQGHLWTVGVCKMAFVCLTPCTGAGRGTALTVLSLLHRQGQGDYPAALGRQLSASPAIPPLEKIAPFGCIICTFLF